MSAFDWPITQLFRKFKYPPNINFGFQDTYSLFLMGKAKKKIEFLKNSMQVRQHKAQICAFVRVRDSILVEMGLRQVGFSASILVEIGLRQVGLGIVSWLKWVYDKYG
jgi:hypothetical protein